MTQDTAAFAVDDYINPAFVDQSAHPHDQPSQIYSPHDIMSLLAQPSASLDQQQQQLDLLRNILSDVVQQQTAPLVAADDPWLTQPLATASDTINPLQVLSSPVPQKPEPFQLVPLTMSYQDEEELPPSMLDPETYRSLSSKERRQMRNKISARNFRLRRKEYIQQLEQQAKEQQQEVQSLRNRIQELELEHAKTRDELDAYKSRFGDLNARNMRLTPTANQIYKDRNTSSRSAAERVASPSWMEQRLVIHHVHVQVPSFDEFALFSHAEEESSAFVPLTKSAFVEQVDEVQLVREWIEQFASITKA